MSQSVDPSLRPSGLADALSRRQGQEASKKAPEAQAPELSRACTVACLDVRPATDAPKVSPGPADPGVVTFASQRIQQVVRDDDRICPMGASRLTVVFGAGGTAIPAPLLGERLARAVGQHLLVGGTPVDLSVSVGMATAAEDSVTAEPVQLALSAIRAARPHEGRAADPSSRLTVTVDRLCGTETSLHLRRRTHCCLPGNRLPWDRARRGAGPTRSDDEHARRLNVLVVDPSPSSAGVPGLGAMTGASIAQRLGFDAIAVAATDHRDVTLGLDGVMPQVVVLVLGTNASAGLPIWSSSAWGLSARLAAAYTSAGIKVVAVDTGAAAGALAGCVAQGATALFHLDQLADELHSTAQGTARSVEAATSIARPLRASGRRLPPRFDALVQLTPGEHRVLFYLTCGLTAQDIAEHLVVSLTTVRSHIRSILRKLNVRSQLAAVAIANGKALDLEDVDQEALSS